MFVYMQVKCEFVCSAFLFQVGLVSMRAIQIMDPSCNVVFFSRVLAVDSKPRFVLSIILGVYG